MKIQPTLTVIMFFSLLVCCQVKENRSHPNCLKGKWRSVKSYDHKYMELDISDSTFIEITYDELSKIKMSESPPAIYHFASNSLIRIDHKGNPKVADSYRSAMVHCGDTLSFTHPERRLREDIAVLFLHRFVKVN